MSEDQRGKAQRPVTRDELQQILAAYCERHGITADLTEHCSCSCGSRRMAIGPRPSGGRDTTDDPDGRQGREPVNLTDDPPAEVADAPPRNCW